MKMDPDFESTFVRVIGLFGFILATVAFFLMMSGMTEGYGEDPGSVMFMAFVMCTALAFVGLMISTLAQVLRTLKSIETLLADQKKAVEAAATAKPATKTAAKKAAAKTTSSKTTSKKKKTA